MKVEAPIEKPQEIQPRYCEAETKTALFLHQLDFAAIVLVGFSVGLLFLSGAIWGLVEVVKLLKNHWSSSLDRLLVLVLCAATFWVLVRWRKNRPF